MSNNPVIGITAGFDAGGDIWLRHQYANAILSVGGTPVVLPAVGNPGDALRFCDGILLSGGGDIDPEYYGLTDYDKSLLTDFSPARDRYELELAKLAWQRVPLFCICRGIQTLNVALGGTLCYNIPGHRQKQERPIASHMVHIEAGTRLHAIVGETSIGTNSFHHQALDGIAPPLHVTARAEDGTVEAVESDRQFCIGVQWHPEHMTAVSSAAFKLFQAFVEACRK